MCGIGTPECAEFNDRLLNIVLEVDKAKEKLSKDEYKTFVVTLHNHMRETMDLPNMMFTIATNKECTEVRLIFFDKEPNGNYYKTFTEKKEDKITFYIEVED